MRFSRVCRRTPTRRPQGIRVPAGPAVEVLKLYLRDLEAFDKGYGHG